MLGVAASGDVLVASGFQANKRAKSHAITTKSLNEASRSLAME
jgi:hypothetical protein